MHPKLNLTSLRTLLCVTLPGTKPPPPGLWASLPFPPWPQLVAALPQQECDPTECFRAWGHLQSSRYLTRELPPWAIAGVRDFLNLPQGPDVYPRETSITALGWDQQPHCECGAQGGSSPSQLAVSHSFATHSISITSPMKLLNGRGPEGDQAGPDFISE